MRVINVRDHALIVRSSLARVGRDRVINIVADVFPAHAVNQFKALVDLDVGVLDVALVLAGDPRVDRCPKGLGGCRWCG
jgi:hypothetical protein